MIAVNAEIIMNAKNAVPTAIALAVVNAATDITIDTDIIQYIIR